MRLWFRNRNESIDQRVKRLEFANVLLAINILLLIIGFSIYSFRMRFIINDIINNIDGVIAVMSGVFDRLQVIDNSFRAISEIIGEFDEAFLEFREILG